MIKAILLKIWEAIEVAAAIVAIYVLVCIAFAW